jgi:hypothetical protein
MADKSHSDKRGVLDARSDSMEAGERRRHNLLYAGEGVPVPPLRNTDRGGLPAVAAEEASTDANLIRETSVEASSRSTNGQAEVTSYSEGSMREQACVSGGMQAIAIPIASIVIDPSHCPDPDNVRVLQDFIRLLGLRTPISVRRVTKGYQ